MFLKTQPSLLCLCAVPSAKKKYRRVKVMKTFMSVSFWYTCVFAGVLPQANFFFKKKMCYLGTCRLLSKKCLSSLQNYPSGVCNLWKMEIWSTINCPDTTSRSLAVCLWCDFNDRPFSVTTSTWGSRRAYCNVVVPLQYISRMSAPIHSLSLCLSSVLLAHGSDQRYTDRRRHARHWLCPCLLKRFCVIQRGTKKKKKNLPGTYAFVCIRLSMWETSHAVFSNNTAGMQHQCWSLISPCIRPRGGVCIPKKEICTCEKLVAKYNSGEYVCVKKK